MCNLFIAFYKFIICHKAKAYLGDFQTSIISFFSQKNFIMNVWQDLKSAARAVAVAST